MLPSSSNYSRAVLIKKPTCRYHFAYNTHKELLVLQSPPRKRKQCNFCNFFFEGGRQCESGK